MAGGLACLAPGGPGRGVAVRERRGQDGGMRSSIAGLRCIRYWNSTGCPIGRAQGQRPGVAGTSAVGALRAGRRLF